MANEIQDLKSGNRKRNSGMKFRTRNAMLNIGITKTRSEAADQGQNVDLAVLSFTDIPARRE